MLEFLIAVVVLVVASLGSLIWAIRHPERAARLYDLPRWQRAHRWIMVVTGALLFGAWLGGAPDGALLGIVVVGLIVGFIPSRFVSNAKGNEWWR